MKKLISATIATSLTVLSLSATAEKFNVDETCTQAGELSAKIMEKRQNGESISFLINKLAPGDKSPFVRKLIIQAYKHPNFSSEEYKIKVVKDFRNTVELECFKHFLKI